MNLSYKRCFCNLLYYYQVIKCFVGQAEYLEGPSEIGTEARDIWEAETADQPSAAR